MTTHLKQRLGLRVRALRTLRGLTQERLAEAVERTPEAVSNIERGLSLPSIDTLERMAGALGVRFADLFDETAGPAAARRVEIEARLQAIVRALSDEDAEIALAQIEALARLRRQSRGT